MTRLGFCQHLCDSAGIRHTHADFKEVGIDPCFEMRLRPAEAEGEYGLAIGNIVGSNNFNLLAVIGAAATIAERRRLFYIQNAAKASTG